MGANNDKRIKQADSIEIYACGISKALVCKKEKNICNKMIKPYESY